MIGSECMIEKEFFCLVVVIMNYILRVLTYKSVKHTVITACNNKIEQGENNELFYIFVCSYLGGKKSLIIFTMKSQCPTRIERIMVLNTLKTEGRAFREYRKYIPMLCLISLEKCLPKLYNLYIDTMFMLSESELPIGQPGIT